MKTEVHGQARLSECGKYLTITTMARRGKKFVPNVQRYEIAASPSDHEVAFPVISLKKDDGTEYHVAKTQWGWECSCAHSVFSGGQECKHLRACRVTRLLEAKPYNEQSQTDS